MKVAVIDSISRRPVSQAGSQLTTWQATQSTPLTDSQNTEHHSQPFEGKHPKLKIDDGHNRESKV